jgi:hypothetical protein
VLNYQSIFPSKGNHIYFLQNEYRVPVEIWGGVRIVYFFNISVSLSFRIIVLRN